MYRKSVSSMIAVAATFFLAVAPNQAATLLATGFDATTNNGSTLGNITYSVENGLSGPMSLNSNPLHATVDATGHYAPNIQVNNGMWDVDIPLTVTASAVNVDNVTLDRQHFNVAGSFNTATNKTYPITATLTGSSSGQVGQVTVDPNPWPSPAATETFNFGGVTLGSSETWTLNVQVNDGTGTNSGIYVGFDGFAVDGSVVTPPAAPPTAPIVYEGFQYNNPGDQLAGKPDAAGGVDATGLDGNWVDATGGTSMFLKAGNLNFGDLPTAGNHIGFSSNANNDIFNRQLTTDAQSEVAGADGIWFSVLFEKLQNNFGAGEGGFVLGNQALGNSRVFENGASTPINGLQGFGFAPTTAGDDLTPYAWDGSMIVAGDAAISAPPASPGSGAGANTSGSNLGDVKLLVGQISFDTGPGGADEYTLYSYQLNGGSIMGGSLNQIASTLLIDVDQSLLDTINLTRQVNLNWDELRIAETLDLVLGIEPEVVPEPATAMLAMIGAAGLMRRRRR